MEFIRYHCSNLIKASIGYCLMYQFCLVEEPKYVEVIINIYILDSLIFQLDPDEP